MFALVVGVCGTGAGCMVVWGGVQEQVQVQIPFLVCVGFLLLQRSLALVLGGCGTGAG